MVLPTPLLGLGSFLQGGSEQAESMMHGLVRAAILPVSRDLKFSSGGGGAI